MCPEKKKSLEELVRLNSLERDYFSGLHGEQNKRKRILKKKQICCQYIQCIILLRPGDANKNRLHVM